jgi:hypothetical protein
MKKLWFFLFSVMTLSSCVDYPGVDEPAVTSDYTVKVNGLKTKNNDTVYVALNEVTLLEMLDTHGNKVDAVFRSSNLSSSFGTGTIADIQYSAIGVYRVTVSLIGGDKTLTVYISVQKSTNYSLKINGVTFADGVTFKATTAQSLKFKVVDPDNKAVSTTFDFGNDSRIKADSTTYYYSSAGTYTFKATTGNKVFTLTMVVTKGAAEVVILISSSISGTTINATLGFRANAIPNFSASKATYVVGEIPNVSWKKYDVSESTTIGGVDYFKWNVSITTGKFRLSWIQQKDPSVTFNYDLCNWSYDPTSNFWNTSDYLYYFYLRIENNVVVISAS